MEMPIKSISPAEINYIINKELNPKKAPGYDLITGFVLKKLPTKGVLFLTRLFNAILRTAHIPSQWKVAQIIMIKKPCKPPNDVSSYRPISLLPIISKIFEKLLLRRIKGQIEEQNAIPNHQFGFRTQHSTVEQANRVYNTIANALEERTFCSAVFLDIQQAFDKVWHLGLLYKIKQVMPKYYLLLKSYLNNRSFQIKHGAEITDLYPIKSGVPQGSVLGPVLYTLFTADLPVRRDTVVATFADDTAIMATHRNEVAASKILQKGLNDVQTWLTKWRLQASATKSVHITFTMRKKECPPVTLNDHPLPRVSEVKYLGLHFDRRLTWANHIRKKKKRTGHKTSANVLAPGQKVQTIAQKQSRDIQSNPEAHLDIWHPAMGNS